VAARSGGIPEMIRHGESGLLIEPGHAESFANALYQVLSETEFRRRIVHCAFDRCGTDFSLSRFVQQVSDVYEQVLVGDSADVN